MLKRKNHWLRFVLVLAVLFCFEKETGAQANDQYASAIATSRAAIQTMMQSSQTPAVSVAVAMNGEIVWSETFGFADLEQKKRATTKTRFGLGSVTKPFTGVLAARLMEEGKFDLNAPVEKYLPQFPHKNKNLTARLIIAHLSGLNDEYNNSHYYEKRHLTTHVALNEILRANTLAYEPGTRHEYTTSNYTIVAAIIEQASGKDFAAAMRHYVLQPLGLQCTSFNDRTRPLAEAAAFYVKESSRVVKAPEYDPSYKWAGAGLMASAEDVARYGSALLREGFLKPNTRAEIFRGLRTSSGEETNYALGWYLGKDKNGSRIYEHGGGGPGISSYIRLYPQEDFVLVMLSNLTNAPVNGETAPSIAEAFLSVKNSDVPQDKSSWEDRPDFAKNFTDAGVEGAFVLYDLKHDKYLAYNTERLQRGFLPASTFKLFNALVALETGVIRDENETLKWDGVRRDIAAWNQDHSLRSGFKVSAVWFYQELARRIGAERMQHYVNLAGYGNCDTSGGIDQFWLAGGLRITPREQIEFLVRLYQNQLPFSQRTMELVKDIAIFEQGEGYVLRAKTGWAGKVGWFVGYVERGEKVYFFANNIDVAKSGDEKARVALAKSILQDLGLIESSTSN